MTYTSATLGLHGMGWISLQGGVTVGGIPRRAVAEGRKVLRFIVYVLSMFTNCTYFLRGPEIVYEIKNGELCNERFPYWPTVSVKIRRVRPPPCNDRPHQHVKLVFVFCYMRSRKVSASSSPPLPSLVFKLIPLSGMRWQFCVRKLTAVIMRAQFICL